MVITSSPGKHLVNGNGYGDKSPPADSLQDGGNSPDVVDKKNTFFVKRSEMSTLLAGLGPSAEACEDNFLANDVTIKDLSALNDVDLELLGIVDKKIQREFTELVQLIPNQLQHYEQILRNTDAADYNNSVLEQTAKQLRDLRTALLALKIKVELNPPKDILLDERKHASAVVLETIDQLTQNIEETEGALFGLHDDFQPPMRHDPKYRKMITIAGVTGSTLVIGYGLYRFLLGHK